MSNNPKKYETKYYKTLAPLFNRTQNQSKFEVKTDIIKIVKIITNNEKTDSEIVIFWEILFLFCFVYFDCQGCLKGSVDFLIEYLRGLSFLSYFLVNVMGKTN